MDKNCLVLTQFRENSQYNDSIGRSYHFPKKYLSQFGKLPIEFVYYEPTKTGEGVYFGFGKVIEKPINDKKSDDLFFVKINEFKPFTSPVSYKHLSGKIREADSPHYNSQNAVRKINKELLDEICLDGKIELNFRADAHLIKVLGEQLIASEKVGILELIKNAYDAGATYCRIRIENLPNLPTVNKSENWFPELPGPVIIIEDDGLGMTRETIEDGWLRPASTLKTIVKENIKRERISAAITGKLGAFNQLISEIKKERGGRIPLGEKGVGRFASSRLGRYLQLRTKTSDLDYELVLDIDWDKFNIIENEIKNLDEVGIVLSREEPSRDYGEKNSGTRLIIYGNREGFIWDESTILELNRSISSLNSPNPNPEKNYSKNGFMAFLECAQLIQVPLNNIPNIFSPIFTFNGNVSSDGLLNYSLDFIPPKDVPMIPETISEKKYDLRKSEKQYWESNGYLKTPECGSFYIHVEVWYRKSPWISGPEGKDFINYLTNFGGISIYRDGINIFPAEWGAETDWLDLSKRHIKQGFRLSYYNMIGNLEIDQLDNLDLTDKTDREGLIDNVAFKDLSHLVQAIIEGVIETKFIAKREEYTNLTGEVIRDPKLLVEFTKQGIGLIDGISNKYPLDEDPFRILDQLGTQGERSDKLINLSRSLKNMQKSIQLMEEVQDLLTEQAGYGMAIAVSVHEIAKITTNFYSGISYLLRSKNIDVKKLQDLKDASESLHSELNRLSPMRAIKNESPTEFEIIRPLSFVIELFKTQLEKNHIRVDINSDQSFQLYGRYGTLIQIFSNLFDNSCYWLGMTSEENRIIKIELNKKTRTVLVADSGPGIDQIILHYIFQPGYSLRIPPSGLGLYICRHYMRSMNGDVYLTTDRERIAKLSGAQFTLDFSRVQSEKETEGVK